MIAGSICRKTGFYYCAECTKSDVEQFGEPYMHREHQLQGIDYCPRHEVQLRKYPVDTTSRIEYIRFELKNMNLSSKYEENPLQKFQFTYQNKHINYCNYRYINFHEKILS